MKLLILFCLAMLGSQQANATDFYKWSLTVEYPSHEEKTYAIHDSTFTVPLNRKDWICSVLTVDGMGGVACSWGSHIVQLPVGCSASVTANSGTFSLGGKIGLTIISLSCEKI